jgi:hypothetical protein
MNVANSAQLRPPGESGPAERGVLSGALASEFVGDGFCVRITGTVGIFGEGADFAASDVFFKRGPVSGDTERLEALDSLVDRLVGFFGCSKVIMLAAKLRSAKRNMDIPHADKHPIALLRSNLITPCSKQIFHNLDESFTSLLIHH